MAESGRHPRWQAGGGTPARHGHRYAHHHCEVSMASTTDRGYGAEHQRVRKALLAEAIGQPCHHCGLPMLPGQALDLDHTADRTAYRGFAHASCNRSEGARRGNKGRKRTLDMRTSENW